MKTSNKFNKVLEKIFPKAVGTAVFTFTEKILSDKIAPVLAKMKEYNYPLTQEEQIQRIVNFAIIHQSPEIIYEAVGLGMDLDQKVDYLEQKTILSIITQYPYYHELFCYLIDAGANPYCKTGPGDKYFLSNALYCCVTYDEHLNILYLIEKKCCSFQDALECCYSQEKIHLLRYLLEVFPSEERHQFKHYVEMTPSAFRAQVSEFIDI